MAGETITIKLGGKVYKLPPLPIAATRQVQKLNNHFLKHVTDEDFDTLEHTLKVVALGLKYAEPSVSEEEFEKLSFFGAEELEDMSKAIMDQSGLKKKSQEGQTSESPLPQGETQTKTSTSS